MSEETPRPSKHGAMSSIEERVHKNYIPDDETPWEEYQRLGHESYFEKNNRLDGLTKEQVEVKSKNFDKETLKRLFKKDSNKTDNFK
jgi:hypothetical protein